MSNAEVFEKMDLSTPDLVHENAQKIAQLFPNCVVESRGSDGAVKHSIDFDALKQELSHDVASDDAQRYQMTWPGKAESVIEGNAPIDKTLRPSRDESVDFDTTKNLFIEGDNLDALKLLQETYLGKVKMIYIDPPYNTGKDFVYKDNFKAKKADFDEDSDYTDEEGGRLVSNPESNGRYHSDWLSMIYPRLRLARNLLSDDGVIFISIDDNEQHNLRKLCDEVFGEDNFVGCITIQGNPRGRDYGGIARMHDYLFVYRKTFNASLSGIDNKEKKFPYEDADGGFETRELRNRNIAFNKGNRPNLYYQFYVNESSSDLNGFKEISLDKKDGWFELYPKESQGVHTVWRWGKERAEKYINTVIVGKAMKDGGYQIVDKYRETRQMARSIWADKNVNTEKGTLLVKELFKGKIFDFPKPVEMIKNTIEMATQPNDLILDFFAGSGTTAHAVMALNAEDGGNRKCISVQLPEVTDSKSEAYKAGYKTIAEISKERLRRAGKKILADNAESKEPKDLSNLDTGFRVLKVAIGNRLNIKDVPSAERQEGLFDKIGNIKSDRSGEDLLFGVMLDWGIDLSLPIETLSIGDKTVYAVYDRTDLEVTYPLLMACFSDDITDAFTQEIATNHKPMRMVFKDESFRGNDSAKINTAEIFKTISPATQVKVI